MIAGVEQIIGSYEDDKVYDLFIALDASDKGRLAGAQKYFVRQNTGSVLTIISAIRAMPMRI